MNVRYSKQALRQVESALTYIHARSPSGADNVRRRLIELVATLSNRPMIGRQTSRAGVRRASLVPYPYTLDYRVTSKEIILLRFRHTARRPLA